MTNALLKNKALTISIAGAVCVIILIAMLILHAWPLWAGKPIYLKVQPVDPRDLFRGDYVTLTYEVSRLRLTEDEPKDAWQRGMYVRPLDEALLKDDGSVRRGTPLFIQFKEQPSTRPGLPATYQPVSISEKPQPGAINLMGQTNSEIYGHYVGMDYGIDAYYVQEHTGHDIEDAIRQGKEVYAEVYVTPNGKPRLKTLIIDGKRLDE